MKKLLITVSIFAIFISIFFIACNKKNEKTTTFETILRDDPKAEFGNFTPTVIRFSESNTRVDVNFVETPVVLTLNLREKNSNAYLDIIKSAIKSSTPIFIYIYKNGMIGSKLEIASIKEASPDIINKSKREVSLSSVPLSKENDIPPMPSEAVMNSIFNLCKNDPDQAFDFKPDGCYARAHKMMAIIAQNGYMCGKQFIYGNLAVTVNGSCCQTWGWHVAPLIRFKNSSGAIEVRIFDPSVSNTPLTKEQWYALCTSSCTPGSSISQYFLARPEVYNRNPTTGQVTYDNNLSKTYCTLNLYKQFSGGCVWPPSGACSW